jgi:hypothetical protein
VGFEKAKFEIIQKSSKKFSRITNETKDDLLKDLEAYNFNKVIEEIIKNILESKFEIKDIHSMIIVLSELHQIYEGFNTKFLEGLKKLLNESYNETSKPSKSEDEEDKKINRRIAISSLYIETYLYGLNKSFNSVKDIFSKILQNKNQKDIFFQEFPIFVYILKEYGLYLFNIKSRKIIKLINEKKIQDFNIETPHSQNINKNFFNGLKEFYVKKILSFLEEEHTKLNELEKQTFESVKITNNENDNSLSYQKKRNNYLKFISLINKFAESMNFDIPELANEKTFRYEQQKKGETKMEKINKYDPFSDEKEYKFYTVPISVNLFEKIKTKPDDKYDHSKKLDNLLSKIYKCDTKETIDDVSDDILANAILNQTKIRNYVFNSIINNEKVELSNIKFYARLVYNISPIFNDLNNDLIKLLNNNFYDLFKKNDNLQTQLRNIKFISELVKFGLFPLKNIFDILKFLIDDFKGKSIDLLCTLLDTCGRFLYLNEISHNQFKTFLDNLKRMNHNNNYEEIVFNKINNSLSICKPQEKSLRKKVKVRSIEEEYIRFLIYQILNKENVKKIAILLRKLDWKKNENIIFKVIFKYLVTSNEEKIKICCEMLSQLKDYHPQFIINLINIILEQIRIGLERNDFNDNQHKILLSMIIGYFYMNNILKTGLLYYVLYMIIQFNPFWSNGNRNLCADNILDSPLDTFRILMIVTILDIVGNKLNNKKKREKLDEFIQFFQIYILTKQYLPLEVENRITNCFEHMNNKYIIYNDFSAALKDSKNKDLNFSIEDLKEFETKNKVNDKEKIEEEKKENNNNNNKDNNEFKRNERNEKIIDVDEEISKIISDSLTKAKGSTMMHTIINPYGDIKKKELIKTEPQAGKFILFIKKDNKIIMNEVDKNVKKEEEDEIEEDEKE